MALTDETKLNRTSTVRPESTMSPKGDPRGVAISTLGLLDAVPGGMAALVEAQRISELAAGEGFEWDSVDDVWAQVDEERVEFTRESRGSSEASLEFGDLLFALVNVARLEGIEAEAALAASNAKFRHRWAAMERLAQARGTALEELSTEEQNVLWREVKAREGATTHAVQGGA